MKLTKQPPNSQTSAAFVDARHIAARYSVSPRQILLMAADNRIPCLKLGKKCIRFNEADVSLALESKSTPNPNSLN